VNSVRHLASVLDCSTYRCAAQVNDYRFSDIIWSRTKSAKEIKDTSQVKVPELGEVTFKVKYAMPVSIIYAYVKLFM